MPKLGRKVEVGNAQVPVHGSIVSCVGGRVRFRIVPTHRHPQTMQQIAQSLGDHPQVHRVKTNLATGSILIHHDPENHGLANILTTLKDIGVILGEITEPTLIGEQSIAAANLTSAIADLNDRVKKTSRDWVDLRLLFPLLLFLLALQQLRRKGLQLDGAPWYVLAWYAFDGFVKLHPTASSSQSVSSFAATISESANGGKIPASKKQRAKS